MRTDHSYYLSEPLNSDDPLPVICPPWFLRKFGVKGGASEFNDSDSILLSLFFIFRIRSFDNFTTNENLDHTEKMPKYDHILSEVDGLHGKGMGSQSKIPRDLTFLPKTKKSILEISVDIIMWSPSWLLEKMVPLVISTDGLFLYRTFGLASAIRNKVEGYWLVKNFSLWQTFQNLRVKIGS